LQDSFEKQRIEYEKKFGEVLRKQEDRQFDSATKAMVDGFVEVTSLILDRLFSLLESNK